MKKRDYKELKRIFKPTTKMKEFNLSEKIVDNHYKGMLHTEDVREFIKKLKGYIHAREEKLISRVGLTNAINKLAGDDLK